MNSARTIDGLVHVFGSISGYTTLACDPGISPADREALELLGFGQTDDENYLSSLNDLPVALGRALPSGRYAVTRCFLGPADSAGRTTLRFISLVVDPQDWIDCVSVGLWSVLNTSQAWIWSDSNSRTHVRVEVIPSELDRHWRNDLIAILSGWLHAASTKTVVACRDDERSRRLVAILPCLLPPSDRRMFRWGIGLLAPGSVADICTLSAIAETSSRRPVVWLPSQRVTAAPYAEALSQFWRPGTPPPWEFISNVPSCFSFDPASFGRDPVGAAPVRESQTGNRALRSIAIAAVLVVALFLAIVGGVLASRKTVIDPVASQPEQARLGDTAPEQPPSGTVDSVHQVDDASRQENVNNAGLKQPEASKPASPVAVPPIQSDTTPQEVNPPIKVIENDDAFRPIESKKTIETSTKPPVSPTSTEAVPEKPSDTSPLPTYESLLKDREEAFAATKKLDPANSANFFDKKVQFASLEQIIKWDALFRNIELYNAGQSALSAGKKKFIEWGSREQESRVVAGRVIAAAVEKQARDLEAHYNLNDETKHMMQPTDPTFLELEAKTKQLYAMYSDGQYITRVNGFVRAIRKKP